MHYRISVIIPCYNQEKHLDKCLQSLWSQTYTHWECILVDDGSTDGTAGIIEKWTGRDCRFRSMHQPNSGVSTARNRGIDFSTGDYIFFMDSDDYFFSDENLGMFASEMKPGTDIISANFCYDNGSGELTDEERGKITVREEFGGSDVLKAFFNKKITGITCNKMFSKSLIDGHNLRFIKQMAYSEDMLLLLEALSVAEKLINIPECTYCYLRGHSSAATAVNNPVKAKKYRESQIMALEKIALLANREKRWQAVPFRNVIDFFILQYSFLKTESLLENRKEWQECYRKIRKIYRNSPYYSIERRFVYPPSVAYLAYSTVRTMKPGNFLTNIAGRLVTF